ncbi:hypothetical protein TrRE_jg4548, partial [Triparma retinervis]
MPKWVEGVLMNVVGQICINLGTNVMKFGHALQDVPSHVDGKGGFDDMKLESGGQRLSADDYDFDPEDEDEGLNPTEEGSRFKGKSKWVKRVGAFLFMIGGVLNFVSFSYAAQSLLASLGSVQFVSNVVFGKFVLGEKVFCRTWLATLVICMGNILIVYYSNRDTKEYTANELLEAYTLDYKWYCLAAFVFLIVVQRIYNYCGRLIHAFESKRLAAPNGYKTSQAICYSLFSAILGTQQMLQAKCLSELLRMTVSGNNQMLKPFTYAVIFIYIVATVFWLYRMNEALRRYDGLFIIPVLQVFWLVFTIVSGGIYFQEFHHFSQTQMIGFCIGVLVVFYGVYLLMPTEKEEDHHELLCDDGNRDSDLFPQLDTDISYEDFDGKRRSGHGNDDGAPPLPPGLPPLGEGIPSSPDRRARDGRTGSLESADGVRRNSAEYIRKRRKKKSMAFGFYDEKRRSQIRLMGFGFMPVVSMDKKVNKFTDYLIEKEKYLAPVEKLSKRVFRPFTGGNKGFRRGKSSNNGLVELEELRRRTLTADGVVDGRSGRIVGANDINLKVLNE